MIDKNILKEILKDTDDFMWKTIESFVEGKISFSCIEPTINEYLETQIRERIHI